MLVSILVQNFAIYWCGFLCLIKGHNRTRTERSVICNAYFPVVNNARLIGNKRKKPRFKGGADEEALL